MSETTTLFGQGETRAARTPRPASRGAHAVAFFSHRAPFDAAVNVACALGAALLLRSSAAHGWLLAWLGVVAVAVAGRFLSHVAQRRCAEDSQMERAWAASFLAFTALNGVAWGALAFGAFDVPSASHLTGVLVLVAFAVASSVHALAPFNAAFPLYYAGAVLPWALRAAHANNPGAFPEPIAARFSEWFGQPTDPALLSLFFGFGLVLGMIYLTTRRNAVTLLRLQQQSIALMQARDTEAHRRGKAEADLKDAEADLQDVDAELKEVDLALSQEQAEHSRLKDEFETRLADEMSSHRTVLQEVTDALNREREQHRQTRAALLVAQEHGIIAPEGGESSPAARPEAPVESAAPAAPAGPETDHLLGRIETLLDFARLGPGELPREATSFSLRGVVDTCCTPLAEIARDKGAGLSVSVSDDVEDQLRGDETRLRRILAEVVGAAIDVSAPDEILVSATMDSTSEASLVLRLSVQVKRVESDALDFESLLSRQEEGTETHSEEGSERAIGLALAAGLARSLGGRLWSESTAAGSAAVRVALPFESAAEEMATVSSLRSVAATRDQTDESAVADDRPKILVANEDPVDQAAIRELLSSRGYACAIVVDGATAVESVSTGEYALAILDTSLPVVDGLAAATRIREFEAAKGRHTPLVALGAHDTDVDRRICRAAGMDDFIPKPVDPEELCAAVARQLGAAHEMAKSAQRLGRS